MKKLLLLLCLPPLIVLNSCKDKKLLTVPIEMSFNTPFPTPGIEATDSLIILETFRFPTAIDAVLAAQNSAKELLEEVFLDQMEMTLVSPQSTTFNLLKQIDVYMKAEGLPEKLGAYLHDIPQTDLKTINLTPSGNDMKEYLKKNEIFLVIKLVLREPLESGTLISIKTKYKGRAGVL